jgi:thiamine pyrophosphate-dependent acetolactate synthase large subunit-like protein
VTQSKAYQLVAKTLSELGHDTIFGLLGSGNFQFTDSFARDFGGRFVWVRHESGAVAAAATYAQVTGRLGIACVHQGPGVTNTLTTLTHAVRERQPVLLLAGETSRGIVVNQTIDLPAFAAAAGARIVQVKDVGNVIDAIAHATETALRDQIPVVVGIPVDIQQEEAEWHELPAPASRNTPRGRPSDEDISRAADLIEASTRPLVLAGRGAVLADARTSLEALGDRIGSLFGTSLVANGFFSGNPLSVGVCGGFSSELVPEIVPQADLVLAFGATLNQWTTMHSTLIDRSKVIQCDTEEAAIGVNGPVQLGLIGDAAETAAALLAELERRGHSSSGFRGTDVELQLKAFVAAEQYEEVVEDGVVDPRSFVVALDRLLPQERTVTYDSGHFHWFPTPYLSVPDAAGFVAAQGFQSVGIGLGVAVGAAVARPDRTVLLCIGDGGTLMGLGDLDAIIGQNLNVVVAVFNDGAYGAEVHHFEPMGFSAEHITLGDRDLAGVAKALGGQAATIRSIAELEQSVSDWKEQGGGPLLLDCKVNPRVRSERLQEAFRRH